MIHTSTEAEAEWTGFISEEEKKQYWATYSWKAQNEHKYDVYDEINADQIAAGFPADFGMNIV